MKRFEGSPAPWRINGVDYHDYGLIDAEGVEIMLLKAECEQDDHNATLIAAAPDLLEALQTIQAKMSDFIKLANEVGINDADGFYLAAATDADEQARAAISKALGEE